MATTLDHEVYTEPDAARLLRVAPSTLRYWLQGGTQRGVSHLPVIRTDAVTRHGVTWAEFIEAGWLRAYRWKKVPMKELRHFIDLLREQFGVPYPLAHRQPLVSGRRLVLKAQQRADLDPTFRLVDDQLLLTYPGRQFIEQVFWEAT